MNKKIIILSMCIAIFIMIIGYSAFISNIKINGTANITSTWNILFTKIEQKSKTDGVIVKEEPKASGTLATFNVAFTKPGDSIVYQITVENKGSLNAVIDNIKASNYDNKALYFDIEGIKNGDKLEHGKSMTFTVTIKYNENTDILDMLFDELVVDITYVQDLGQDIPNEDLEIEGPVLTQVTSKDNIILEDSVGKAISNYLIYGNSIQNGIPAPGNYVGINSFGESNTITIENLSNKKKVIIDLTDHEPLRKIGDIADYIDYANQRIVRNVGMYTFTGKEGWWANKETNGSPNYFISQENFAKINGGNNCKKGITAPLLSTLFPYTNLGTDDYHNRKGNSIYGYYDYSACFIITNEFETNEEWAQYLKDQAQKGEPLTILYALETPIYEPITLPIIYTDTGNNKLNINSNISVSKVIIDYYKKRS